jgi:phosphatidylglycerophosphate synthase
MANLISILRIFVAFIAIGLLYVKTSQAYVWALVLTAVSFAMDGLDGWVARKFNEVSNLGSVVDIMGDRIVEAAYWIVFAVLGWISVIFPLICVTRAFTTDSLRSVALSKGYTAFGTNSMQKSRIGSFICSSKFMRISYAVAKVLAFILLVAAYNPGWQEWVYIEQMRLIAVVLAWAAIIFCVIRGLPVIFESGKLFTPTKGNRP